MSIVVAFRRFITKTLVSVVTGGLYYDTETRSALVNVLHIYLWLILFALPLCLSLLRREIVGGDLQHWVPTLDLIFQIAYPLFIFVLFTVIKGTSYCMHRMFDSRKKMSKNKKDTKKKKKGSEEESEAKTQVDSEVKVEDTGNGATEPGNTGLIASVNENESTVQVREMRGEPNSELNLTNQIEGDAIPQLDGPGDERDDSNDGDSRDGGVELRDVAIGSIADEVIQTDSSSSSSSSSSISISNSDGDDGDNDDYGAADIAMDHYEVSLAEQPQMVLQEFSYVDEFGQVQTYEMLVPIEEAQAIASRENESASVPDSDAGSVRQRSTSSPRASHSSLAPNLDSASVTQQSDRNVIRMSIFGDDIEIEVPERRQSEERRRVRNRQSIRRTEQSPSLQVGSAGYSKMPRLFQYPSRLNLEEFCDRHYNFLELLFNILFATFLAWFSFHIYMRIMYTYLSTVFLWAAVAMSHFSLIKCPQPDSHSPVHQSRWTAYSRAFYVIFFGATGSIFQLLTRLSALNRTITFYAITVDLMQLVTVLRDFSTGCIVLFPIIFAFGWLPTCRTFVMVLLEQTHIHMFGGTGISNLPGAIMQIVFDVLATCVLTALGYLSFVYGSFGNDFWGLAVFSGALVSLSYLLSRSPSNPWYYVEAARNAIEVMFTLQRSVQKKKKNQELSDEESQRMRQKQERVGRMKFERNLVGYNATKRLLVDAIISSILFVAAGAIQIADLLRYINPYFIWVLAPIVVLIGFIVHVVFAQLIKKYPFTVVLGNLLPQGIPKAKSGAAGASMQYVPNNVNSDGGAGEGSSSGQKSKSGGIWKTAVQRVRGIRMYRYQIMSLVLKIVEQILYMLAILSSITVAFDRMMAKSLHPLIALIIVSVASIRTTRGILTDSSRAWFAMMLAVIVFSADPTQTFTETFIINFAIAATFTHKLEELWLKMDFMMIYSTPYISWGDFNHILMQPLSIPYFALSVIQLLFSAIISAPVFPLVGGSLWLLTYPRNVKFWERNYRTKRKDVSTMTLSQSLGMAGSSGEWDSNNLNSIFYEHLVVAIRRALPRISRTGELGSLTTGDIICVRKDNLFAMVHFIEVGNGFCSFQVRGVEFKGTICQEREQDAVETAMDNTNGRFLREGLDSLAEKCGPCSPVIDRIQLRDLRDTLSSLWYTWHVIHSKLELETYNVIEHPAESIFMTNDNRCHELTLYVRCCIYYLVRRNELDLWISEASPFASVLEDDDLSDFDPAFSREFDTDFDNARDCVSLESFTYVYGSLIDACIGHREKQRSGTSYDDRSRARIRQLAFATSLVARRAFIQPDGTHSATNPSWFLEQLYQLFKGDYRVMSMKDEWVFGDMSILQSVIVPALRMSLRLYQDQFVLAEMYEDPSALIDAIETEYKDLILAHEGDPVWRESIINDVNELFSLRKIVESSQRGGPVFKILMLERRALDFGVIRLNRESVRSLWAAQIHELVFLGNETAERGSIQQMVHVLRNIINSSCDSPIGYSSFVGPITTAMW